MSSCKLEEVIPIVKAQFIHDLKDGQAVDSIFLVKSKRLRPFKNKPGHYMELELGDATGLISARIWDNAEQLDQGFDEHSAVRIKGQIEEWQQSCQIRVSTIKPCALEEYDPADLLPHTAHAVDELEEKLLSLAQSFTNPHLKQLITAFLKDSDFMHAFKQAPASVRIHHNWIGGLIEHVTSVVEIAEVVCTVHPEINRDLLMTGVLLHDIGKIHEYRWQPDFAYTDEGNLIGHLVIGERMVAVRIADLEGFPTELAQQVRHMLLSHHGTTEFGAVKVPMTLEAVALHQVENMDAQIQRVVSIIESQRKDGVTWTDYDRSMGRRLFMGTDHAEANKHQPGGDSS